MEAHIVYYGDNEELRNLLRRYDYIDLEAIPDYQFIPGDRYLILGHEAYDHIVGHMKIHLGPRREGFYDISKMDYLLTREGYIFKFAYVNYERAQNWINEAQYNAMMPLMDKIRAKFKDASLRMVHSNRKNKDYFIFEYKVISDINDKQTEFLEREDFIKPAPKVRYYKIIRAKEDIISSMDYFIDQPIGSRFGFDYETHGGFPFDSKYFSPMGLGIADINGICAYFDIEYIRDCTDYYQVFINKLREFCDKHGAQVYTYNVSFELRVTYLLLKHMYPFQDSASINKLEGDVAYNLSLKYTAMRYCHVASWDNDFEIMQEYLSYIMNNPDEYFGEVHYNDQWPIYTKETYDQSPDWKVINDMYPGNESEFRRLISINFGDPFGCIPSAVLGKYCCMDAYYTLLLREASDKEGFSDLAWQAFSDNLRLGAHLNINGVIVDKKESEHQHYKGFTAIAYGSLNITKVFIAATLDDLKDLKLPEHQLIRRILERGWNPFDSKSLLRDVQKYEDPSGLNIELMNQVLGDELTNNLVKILKDWDRYPVTDRLFRSRNIFNDLTGALINYYGGEVKDNKFITKDEEIDLSQIGSLIYKYYLINNQKEVNNYLSEIDYNSTCHCLKNLQGNYVDKADIVEYCKGIFNYDSVDEWKMFMCKMFTRYYKPITLTCHYDIMMECLKTGVEPDLTPEIEATNPMDWESPYATIHLFSVVRDKIYNTLKAGLTYFEGTPEDKKDYFEDRRKEMIDQYDRWRKSGEDLVLINQWTKDYAPLANSYELVAYALIREDLNKLVKKEVITEDQCMIEIPESEKQYLIDHKTWTGEHLTAFYDLYKISALGSQLSYQLGSWLAWMFKYRFIGDLSDTDDENGDHAWVEWYAKKVKDIDASEISILGLSKLAFSYATSRKFAKIIGTYVDGMINDTGRQCYDYDENGVSIGRWGEGPIYKSFPHYDVCQKKSKRWSSNFHTIPSKSECKRCVTTPKGFLLTYFDISGMEVRTLSYLAKDEFMMNNYDHGVDPYINLSQMVNPDKDMAFHKSMRSDYKTTLLGSLYGMGPETMGGRIGKTAEDAQKILDIMFKHMKGIRRIIDEKGQYPFDHNGYVETILGDKLNISNEPQDRWSRLGVNLCIQGGSAVLMAFGFENIIQGSFNTGHPIVRPINVVHDSSQNYVQTDFVFDVDTYYHQGLTEFLYDKIGIRYEFDTLIGANYFDMAVLKQLDKDTIELSGTYRSLKGIIDKLNEANVHFELVKLLDKKGNDITEGGLDGPDFKPKVIEDFYLQECRFQYDAIFDYDKSKFTITIKR